MATVRSLGLHEPSAIPFLVAENLLPPDPSDDQYAWKTTVDDGPGGPVDEELVWTKTCVVWSRAGVVRRVFRLDPEKEEIRHALFTHFAAGKIKRSNGDPIQKPGRARGPQSHRGNGSKLVSSGLTLHLNDGDIPGPDGQGQADHAASRALVVVLKSQAHIFFLSGNTHVIPLPFEVDSVFAAPRRLLFQRKIPDDDPDSYPLAPPNSFVSSIPPATDFRASQSLEIPSRPSLTISPAQGRRTSKSKHADLPRVFSLMDPHSEMGLVVSTQSSRFLNSSTSSRPTGLDALDPSDEIVYVSPKNELSGFSRTLLTGPLILVVTVNANTGLYTVWTARYRDDETGSSKKKKRRDTGGTRSKRRSSHFGMATGATTPAARSSAARESFGPMGDNWNASFSHSQNQTKERPDEEDLASKIQQDFGDIGIPLKTSRRVSSLLARADLASSHDRVTFSDLAAGSQSSAVPHGGRQSMGGASNRGSFGFNPRNSLPPGNGSVYSANSTFVDAPADKLLEELNNDVFEGFENMDLKDSTSGLPEEVLLSKVESFSPKFSESFQSSAKPSSRKLKISTLCRSDCGNLQNGNSAALAISIVDQDAKSMAIVNLKVDRVPVHRKEKVFSRKSKNRAGNDRNLLVHATGVHHFPDVWDACTVVDGDISRLLILSEADEGRTELSLQSPWSNPSTIDVPEKLLLYEPYAVSPNKPTREGGMSRVMTDSSLTMVGLDHHSSHGKFDVIDSKNRRHKLQIRMDPSNALVKSVLGVCRFVLRDTEKAGDGILVAWWEVMKWLRTREAIENDLEWTAMVIVLFSMAIPFIASEQVQLGSQTRRKKGLLRSSSGSHVDLENWESMLDQESGSAGVVAPWMMNSSWGWIVEQDAVENSDGCGKSATEPTSSRSTFRQNSYLRGCASLAREFLQSPYGAIVSGPEGCLPTASSYPQSSRRSALCSVLVGLHLLREEQKLSICDADQSHKTLGLLAPVLAQIGRWLGWKSWTWAEDGYFGLEMASMGRWQFEDTQIAMLDVPHEPFTPPSIFHYLENAWYGPSTPFLNLMDLVSSSDRTPRKGRLWQECFALTPRTLALNGFFSELHGFSTSLDRIKLLYRWGFTRSVIETFPEGVNVQLHEAIMQAQVRASTSWNVTLLELIDREDLFLSMNTNNSPPSATPLQPALSHDAVRDFHNIGSSALDIDTTNAFEASAEADRLSVTRLIFRDDKRFVEAARLLNQSKPPVAECAQEPDWSESDLLEAQKEVVQLVTLRTLSVPTGRAMLSFSGRLPLLTEKVPIPSFSLQCIMKPTNVTVSADRASFSEEKVCWAFFHNGVSTGLAISKASKGIDTSWILFNKPQDLTNRHAGFLLALGLNGQLKSLAKWVAFKYLTPKHTMTSIGLLLGLSASYLGTMDTLITRLLSVHVTRMLPMGAAELNLSPMTQTAGIMGIGLLYCNSQHRRMSEVMLSEIENAEHEENSTSHEELRDEGYRLAAGFALGFINLGKGKDLRGMRDMHIVERLLAIAVGTKNVDLAHVLDRATAGATIALTIIFMKTNDEVLARKIDIPDTTMRFDYVRPDLFLLRTLARHLIMWDSIRPSDEWFMQSVPKIYRRRHRLAKVRRLKSDDMPLFNIVSGLCFALGLRYAGTGQTQVRDLLVSYLDQFIRICRLPAVNYDGKLARNSVRNCQDIVALSAATVMAGTGDLALFRRLRSLHGRVDADTPYGSHMAAHMAIGMLFLGGGSYTLGTSDLATASLLCSFYPIFPKNVLDNKCHLQAFRHFWVLAAEPRCLVPRDIDTRRAISAPVTVTTRDSADQKTTAPTLLPNLDSIAKVEVRSPDHWPLILDFGGPNNALRDKFRLGDQSIYLRHKTTYNLSSSSAFASTFSGLTEAQDILPSSASAANHSKGHFPPPLPSLDALLSSSAAAAKNSTAATAASQSPWDWIFNLPALQRLDIRERALVLPASQPRLRTSDQSKVSYAPWLRVSAIDTMLVLEGVVGGVIRAASAPTPASTPTPAAAGRPAEPDEVRDRAWQLRLLFSWIDRCLRAEGDDAGDEDEQIDADSRLGAESGLWLRREFVEEARWKVWGVRREV
ncbi:negative regulator of mitosis [Aspergillus sp. HF37]|nr:negative regulator of mitosis [Aspergillus sp. HF37]